MKNKGFSLVELIVVIAIMAILVGVAVPVYSSYIEKTQKAADQQLVDEIKHAMEIANAAQTLTESAYVKIGADGVVEVGGDGADQLEAVLEATFGDAWEDELKVKYSDWKGVAATGNYGNSNFSGNEGDLIGVVDGLTGALGTIVTTEGVDLESLLGETFIGYLDQYEIDLDDGVGVGNAAALYVAQNTTLNKQVFEGAFDTGLGNGYNSVMESLRNEEFSLADTNGRKTAASRLLNGVMTELQASVGKAAAMAAVYAYAEGYALECGKADEFHANLDFENTTDVGKFLDQLSVGLADVFDADAFMAYATDETQGKADLRGYLDAMETLHTHKDIVSDNLSDPDCFTNSSVENLLQDYAAMSELSITTNLGEIAVMIIVDESGSARTYAVPFGWYK